MAARTLQDDQSTATHLLFDGAQLLAKGDLLAMALACKAHRPAANAAEPVIFEVSSGTAIDIDLSGSLAALRKRFATAPQEHRQRPRARGRPKLGVVGREVTLLPRHWAWLETQRGGASAALRRLVDQARQANRDTDRARASQDRCQRFISVLAGDLPGYEQVTRALYTSDRELFYAQTRRWPVDIRQYARAFASDALNLKTQ